MLGIIPLAIIARRPFTFHERIFTMASQSAGIGVRLSNQHPGVYNQVVASFVLAVLLCFLVPSPGFAAGSEAE